MRHTPHQSGFTLIELILVIALISIVTLVSVPNWRENSARQQMLAAATSMVTDIRNAANTVLTGEAFGQSVQNGVSVEILKAPTSDEWASFSVFINRDGDPFFANSDLINQCSVSGLIPDTRLCDTICTACINDASACISGLVTQASCSAFLETDYELESMALGTLAEDVDQRTVTIGKIRALSQADVRNLASISNFDTQEAVRRVLIEFAYPRADATFRYYSDNAVSPIPGSSVVDDAARLCIEVKARIAAPNEALLTRTMYIDRVGGFTRLMTQWPEEVCGVYTN